MPVLSVCIPTLNRPELFYIALKSIFESGIDPSKIEICISNNASDDCYSEALALIERNKSSFKVLYAKHEQRLSLDNNMQFVTGMATTEYIYYLGDDDYFLSDGLDELLRLIELQAPDLAILNGITVDADGQVLGSHFDLPAKVYTQIDEVFYDLRDKGAFGSVLVKRTLLAREYFEMLHGTSHAYGCFWLALMWHVHNGGAIKVVVPPFQGVALRGGEKTYNHISVYFRDILFSIAVFRRYSPPGELQRLLDIFERRYFSRIYSLRFLLEMASRGARLGEIADYRRSIYNKLLFKIKVVEFIIGSGCFGFLKSIRNKLLRRNK